MDSAKDTQVDGFNMVPLRKTRANLFKRRRVTNKRTIQPRRLDFSGSSLFDDETDKDFTDALMCSETLTEMAVTPKPLPKPVLPETSTPKKHRFDLTGWRRAKITFNDGDDFCRLAHAREQDGTGEAKSFNITLLQLRNLINVYDKISEALQAVKDRSSRKVDLTLHLGSKLHVRVNTPYICMNLRIMEKGPSGLYPTKAGIALRAKEVANFGDNIPALEALLDELDIEPCFHANPEGETACMHCNPYPDTDTLLDSDSDY
jgi:hypothetical protein